MRTVIVVLVLVCGLQLGAHQPDGSLTPDVASRRAADDALSEMLWRIAVSAHTSIGFETVEQTHIGGRVGETPPLGGSTLAGALDSAINADGRYEWRRAGEMIVVRPKGAWTDPADPLNRRVRNLRATGLSPTGVLLGLRDFVYTNRFVPDPKHWGTVSLRVDSGTVIDALNQLTLAADQAMWLSSYQSTTAQRPIPGWGLTFEVRGAEHVTGGSYSPQRVSPNP